MRRTKARSWSLIRPILLALFAYGCGHRWPDVKAPPGFVLNENIRSSLMNHGSQVHGLVVKIRSERASLKFGRPIGAVVSIREPDRIKTILDGLWGSAHRADRKEITDSESDIIFLFHTREAPFVVGFRLNSIEEDYGPAFAQCWSRIESDLAAAYAASPVPSPPKPRRQSTTP